MKTNFHNKNNLHSLAFIMRFKATQQWPVVITGGSIIVRKSVPAFSGLNKVNTICPITMKTDSLQCRRFRAAMFSGRHVGISKS